MINYFTTRELQCKCGCGQCVLMPGFIDKLNDLRDAIGSAMVVTSCCRCQEHNAAIGGKDKSFHLINALAITKLPGACAADISTAGWDQAKKDRFMKLAREKGWSLGIAKTFFHIDRRTDYPEAGWPHRAEWRYT